MRDDPHGIRADAASSTADETVAEVAAGAASTADEVVAVAAFTQRGKATSTVVLRETKRELTGRDGQDQEGVKSEEEVHGVD